MQLPAQNVLLAVHSKMVLKLLTKTMYYQLFIGISFYWHFWLLISFFSRITLESSKFRQTLHSAVIVDNMMVVFGGNPYVNGNNDIKCHTTKLHVYDLGNFFIFIIAELRIFVQ